ncbi:type VII secretion-associated serine protease mycosin [Jongsikchunia kroppenstedtii]|uniref:type VII secretion-associated serine protease mycosin n=1 Tax=Jongsikchunia kroppenstedtii TaxID=1121721 RepID=UPI0006879DCB|nr:type VII secretion-associated serine protease mycosin [Jongsikchunia kroppenstedtii]
MTAARRLGRLGLATLVAFVAVGAAPALAVEPPIIAPGALPPGGAAAPPEPTDQKLLCAKPTTAPGTDYLEPSPGQAMLELATAWKFSRGAGQTVAVIDTGVTRHPRLPRVQPGGDYVSTGDGTADCDGHGTLVAGIIAAQPSASDAFAGVAPDASIIAIRQTSAAFEKRSPARGSESGAIGTGYGSVRTMASAVLRAVELGATVINISEVACAAAGTDLRDQSLGAAIRYAYDHNVVVVAAAGNLGADSSCATQNPPAVAGHGWDAVATVASPAWFAPQLLTVGAVDSRTGRPAGFSLHGPWVSVAAPGTGIVSLDSAPGSGHLVNAQPGRDGLVTIDGTSFAAPYVAGVAALVRAKYPSLTAAEVIDRITATAHAPGTGRDDAIGYGVIDAVAALTDQIPREHRSDTAGRAIDPPAPATGNGGVARVVAISGAVGCLLAVVAAVAISAPRNRRRRLRPDEY